MTNLEAIQALIDRTDKAAQEIPQFDSVPMLEKTKVLALLYQALAMQQIAESLEFIVKAGSFE